MMKRLMMGVIAVSCLYGIARTLAQVPSGDDEAGRVWTDRTGAMQVQAKLLDFNDEKVWLYRDDNRVFAARLDELSEADRTYVRHQAERRAKTLTSQPAPPDGSIAYGPARKLCQLANPLISESSGLVAARGRRGVFFTHNDSGGTAAIYAFDRQGHDLGSFVLKDTRAFDWEDIAAATFDGKNHMLIGDVGNNGLGSDVQMIHVIEEPEVDRAKKVADQVIPIVQTIYFSYEDDHRDCEAFGVDPTDRTVLLMTKQRDVECHVYALPWPQPNAKRATTARKIATMKIPPVTAMDISPDGRRAIVLTYGNAYEYHRSAGEDWAAAFSRPGRMIAMPRREQGESVCYGPDGKTLYLTSEKLPTPLWEIPVKK